MDEMVNCPNCRGDGYNPTDCDLCRGSGEISLSAILTTELASEELNQGVSE